MIKLAPMIKNEGISEAIFSTAMKKQKEGVSLYRGFNKGEYSTFVVDPTKKERTSRNFDNLYTVLLSNLPSWKGWPRRTHSLIFSNDRGEASFYGKLYEVFPENGSKIGVCSKHDFISTSAFPFFEKEIGYDTRPIHASVVDISDTMSRMLSMIPGGIKKKFEAANYKDIKTDGYQSFIDFMNENATLEAVGNIDGPTNIGFVYLTTKKLHGGDWEKFLSYLLDPKKNNFRLITIDEISSVKHIAEMWTEAKCLMKEYE